MREKRTLKKPTIEQWVEMASLQIETDWFFFGAKPFECNGLNEEAMNYYMTKNQLPKPCNSCYKALIFWEESFSKKNMTNFFMMLKSFDFEYSGKFNSGVIVFYFRKKEECLQFVDLLKRKVIEFKVDGKVQWRRACKEFTDSKPELWENAKNFIPDMEDSPKPQKGRQLTF